MKRAGWRFAIIGVALWILAWALSFRFGAAGSSDMDVLMQLRLPRVLMAAALGAGLAVAGAALQALFMNPLCEPYTLGISSGSAIGAILGSALGLGLEYGGVAGGAFAGALLFAAVLYFLSRREGVGSLGLLLAGVMLGFFGSSLVAVWMALADPDGLQGALFWLLGDLSRARLNGAVLTCVAVALLTLNLWTRWRELDALLMGEDDALALGVEVPKLRRRVILLTSVLVGLCVSSAGMIGFVGLVIPHLVRRFAGSMHFTLIPLSAIWGGAALMAADTLGRAVASPIELPVGVVTAIVGAPAFLLVVLRQGRKVG